MKNTSKVIKRFAFVMALVMLITGTVTHIPVMAASVPSALNPVFITKQTCYHESLMVANNTGVVTFNIEFHPNFTGNRTVLRSAIAANPGQGGAPLIQGPVGRTTASGITAAGREVQLTGVVYVRGPLLTTIRIDIDRWVWIEQWTTRVIIAN